MRRVAMSGERCVELERGRRIFRCAGVVAEQAVVAARFRVAEGERPRDDLDRLEAAR